MNTSFPLRPGVRMRLLAFLLCVVPLSLHCYRHPLFSVDLLAYSENVALLHDSDLFTAHKIVYSHQLPPHLLGIDSGEKPAKILQKRAHDPSYSALYLPYFSIKPLYIETLNIIHSNLGIDIFNAIFLVSALSYFGIALCGWLCTRSLLIVPLIALPEIRILGQINEPDAMSTLLVLVGFWLIFIKGKDVGIAVILMSEWVRPDNAIIALLVIGVMYVSKRLNLKYTFALCVISIASVSLISHYGNGWTSLYDHTFLGGEPNSTPHFSFLDYESALNTGLRHVVHNGPLILFWALWLTCISRQNSEQGFRKMLGISGLCFAIRFLMFPSYETRFYGVFFACTAIASASLINKRLAQREVINSHPAMLQTGAAA